MFATCMLFQVIYLLCVMLWLAVPTLRGHELLAAIFPNFELLTIGSFIYGLFASMIYGWIAAILFVFFYNLWPSLIARRGTKAGAAVATGLLCAVVLTGLPSANSSAYAQGAANTSAALPQSTVTALQNALNKQGIAVKADGVFTQETRDAVRKFQSQHHLPVTGEADSATLAKLGVTSSASAAQPGAPSGPGHGGMMSGPMMHGMMQGMMTTMNGMMGMMQARPEQTEAPPAQTESRQTQGQGGMRANCPMGSGESMPAMMQMMQGMMQMMQMMQAQMQSAPRQ
jgi:hypothetical protein